MLRTLATGLFMNVFIESMLQYLQTHLEYNRVLIALSRFRNAGYSPLQSNILKLLPTESQ